MPSTKTAEDLLASTEKKSNVLDTETVSNPLLGNIDSTFHGATSDMGSRLRAYRQSRGLGLKELAAIASISTGILSQIERGMNMPSLRTVEKIRNALGLPMGFFFEEDRLVVADGAGYDAVCRSDQRPVLRFSKQGMSKQLLHHGHPRVFEMMIIDIPPRSSSGLSSYPSEKGALVLEGTLIFTIDEKSTALQVGDSLKFDGIRAHRLENRGDLPAKVMWIIAKLPNDLLL